MNRVTIIGNLTNDPELRTTPNGVAVCTFNVAVNRRFSQQNGERITDFFRVTVWRQQGENCAKFLEKGRKVAVLGEVHASAYTSKDGEARASLEITADEVEFLSARGDGAQQSGGYSPNGGSSSQQSAPASDAFTAASDEDLPF